MIAGLVVAILVFLSVRPSWLLGGIVERCQSCGSLWTTDYGRDVKPPEFVPGFVFGGHKVEVQRIVHCQKCGYERAEAPQRFFVEIPD